MEFRHPSSHRDVSFDLLQEHGAAYCVMSGANLPCILRATAGFVYVRLHAPTITVCTPAGTATTNSGGGLGASASGRPWGATFSSISTTTGLGMPSGTLGC